jgi:Serine carboxypeptidase S28
MAYATLRYFLYTITLLSFISFTNCAPNPRLLQLLGPQGVNLWKLEAAKAVNGSTSSRAFRKPPKLVVQDAQTLHSIPRTTDFRAQWFQQPLDHFFNDSMHTFHQRYWVNDRHYVANKGGPVIVLDGGETSGTVRIFTIDLKPSHKQLVFRIDCRF